MLNKNYISTDVFICIALFILTSVIYIHNLSSGIYGGDSGDFVSAIVTKGIPHPSGYPLYTLLGILFSYVPLAKTLVWKIGLVSALFSSLSVVVMYFLAKEVTKSSIASLLASLLLAFFYPFWVYAEVPEIFALHSFFILLISFLSLLYLRLKNAKVLYALFFTFGLSLTNNESIILLLAPIILLLVVTRDKMVFSREHIIKYVLFFLAGLLPYLYIPIAALHNPPINWEHTNTVRGFFDLVSRKDYGWRFSEKIDTQYIAYSLGIYVTYITLYTNILLLLAGLYGIGHLISKKQHGVSLFFLAAFFCLGPFFVIFSRFPLNNLADLAIMQRFYIGSLLFLIIFMSIGMMGVAETISNIMNKSLVETSRRDYKNYILLVFFLVPIIFFFAWLPKADLSSVRIGETFAEDLLLPLPKDSIVFFSNDTPVFNALYLQYSRNIRTDIQIPGENRLESLAFGNKRLSREEIATMLHTIRLQQVQVAYIMNKLNQSQPIFTETKFQYDEKKYGKITFIPYGLLLKLATSADKKLSESQYIAQQSRVLDGLHVAAFEQARAVLSDDLILSDIKERYIQVFVNTGDYIKSTYKDENKAKAFYAEADKLKQN